MGGLAVFLLFATSCSGSETSASDTPQQEEAEPPTDRPNILFVLTDDLDYASAQKMPRICSRLADEGASFKEAFVSYPLCCPSRATILTGLYAHNHNVKSNRFPDGGFEKFRDEGLEEDTIAVRLQEEDYGPPCSASTSTSTLATKTQLTSRPAGTSGTAGWMRTS